MGWGLLPKNLHQLVSHNAIVNLKFMHRRDQVKFRGKMAEFAI